MAVGFGGQQRAIAPPIPVERRAPARGGAIPRARRYARPRSPTGSRIGRCLAEGRGPQEMLVVNESGVYTLMFTSRRPEARRFRKWVTSVVLPALRQTGRYDISPEEGDPILTGIRAMGDLRRAQLQIEQHCPPLAKAIGSWKAASLALAPHAREVMDWGREEACDPL